jgi:hypothetical protein
MSLLHFSGVGIFGDLVFGGIMNSARLARIGKKTGRVDATVQALTYRQFEELHDDAI